MLTLLAAGDVPIDGFLCPGHVSVIIGAAAYTPVVERYAKPCVVAGFEPAQMLTGLVHLVRQISTNEARLENVYAAAVDSTGNSAALRCIAEVFQPADETWRAIGSIPASGLALRPAYRRFDALHKFELVIGPDYDPPGCKCGEVIQGKIHPRDCPLFGNVCTPVQPVGPCMVSSEGTCAALFKYDRAGTRRALRTVERRS
jgi:hydrogenase expression/formation protein HypD